MMTIADIYDALTAGDRPYKKGIAPDEALDILDHERRAGHLDSALLALFIEAKIYEQALASTVIPSGSRQTPPHAMTALSARTARSDLSAEPTDSSGVE